MRRKDKEEHLETYEATVVLFFNVKGCMWVGDDWDEQDIHQAIVQKLSDSHEIDDCNNWIVEDLETRNRPQNGDMGL